MSAFDTAPPHSWKATSVATGEAPVLEALTDINAVSLARAELDPVTLLLVRIAALAAVDAPASYLMHLRPAVESNVTVEQRQDVLVAVAPIPGAPPASWSPRRTSPRPWASPSPLPRPRQKPTLGPPAGDAALGRLVLVTWQSPRLGKAGSRHRLTRQQNQTWR
jgi:alkylhydroperoxidase/carboxymuconolactone decarboxylase family protein YurZ